MQVVFIAFTLKNSSVAEFFVSLANRLSITHQVIIFTHSTEDHDLFLENSIQILEWPSTRPTKLTDFKFLIRNIRKYKPKTLIASFGAVNLFIIGGFLMRVKHRVAWYHTLSSQLIYNRLLFWRKRILFKMATLIIANSESGKLDAASSFSICRNKIQVLPNAVRNPDLKSNYVPKKLVYVGRLNSIKGIKVLIRALAIVKKKYSNIQLEVIGGEDENGIMLELIKLTEKLKLKSNIRFVGIQPKDYVMQAFATAFCSIVPSYYEAFGYVVIESFSVSTPVIGSNTTGLAEIIEDEVTGLLFKPGNHEELASKLLKLIDNPGMRENLSEQAYNRFLERYEINKVVDGFIKRSSIF